MIDPTDKKKLTDFFKKIERYAIENHPELNHVESYLDYRLFIEAIQKFTN